MGLKQKFARFMSGRHGNDAFNMFLMALSLVILITASFFGISIVSYILRAVAFVLLGYSVYRAFSRSISARNKENAVFLKILYAVKSFFIRQFNRIKYIKTHRYRKCPGCKSHLRLPYKRGTHTVKCPKCGRSFDIKL